VYPEEVGPPGTKDILMRLYPPITSFRRYGMPLYEEILNLLLKAGMSLTGNMPLLLGNHDGHPIHDPLLKELVRQATAKWPKIPIGERGRGGSGFLGGRHNTIDPTGEHVRRVFARTLRLCLGHRPGRELRKARMPVSAMTGNGVIPNARDRLAPARRRLGAPSTLWTQPGEARVRVREKPSRAFVYLDVSGSMNFILSYCLGLLLPYVSKKQAEVFQFSTQVKPLALADLRRGQLNTTGGPSIDCVLEHLLNVEPRVQRVLIVTDGEVGAPASHLAEAVHEQHIRVNVVLPHDGFLNYGVQELASSIVTLPPLH
jgi:hypothetical protein